MRLRDLGEFGLLESLGLLRPARPGPGWVGPGDDTAVLPLEGRNLLLTADALVEDVHFRIPSVPPRDLGYKAVAVNASDVAAMGGEPWALTVTLTAPGSLEAAWVRELYAGLGEACAELGCLVAGGDTTSGAQVVLSVALVGTCGRPVLRSGGRPGHDLYVSGHPGESAAGLAMLERGEAPDHPLVRRHLRPSPRLALGQALARGGLASAMIDVSDGLLQDAGHLTRACACGADVWLERLPVSRRLRVAAAGLGRDPLELVLGGGEDYELLFSCPADRRGAVEAAARAAATPVARIGRLAARPGVRTLRDGRPAPLPDRTGYRHFAP